MTLLDFRVSSLEDSSGVAISPSGLQTMGATASCTMSSADMAAQLASHDDDIRALESRYAELEFRARDIELGIAMELASGRGAAAEEVATKERALSLLTCRVTSLEEQASKFSDRLLAPDLEARLCMAHEAARVVSDFAAGLVEFSRRLSAFEVSVKKRLKGLDHSLLVIAVGEQEAREALATDLDGRYGRLHKCHQKMLADVDQVQRVCLEFKQHHRDSEEQLTVLSDSIEGRFEEHLRLIKSVSRGSQPSQPGLGCSSSASRRAPRRRDPAMEPPVRGCSFVPGSRVRSAGPVCAGKLATVLSVGKCTGTRTGCNVRFDGAVPGSWQWSHESMINAFEELPGRPWIVLPLQLGSFQPSATGPVEEVFLATDLPSGR